MNSLQLAVARRIQSLLTEDQEGMSVAELARMCADEMQNRQRKPEPAPRRASKNSLGFDDWTAL